MVFMVTLILMTGGILLTQNMSAAPAASKTLTATQDSYTDINAPASNFNGGLLSAANSLGSPGDPDIATKYIFLEFDLSSVSFEIKSAALNMATLTCGGLVPVDEVNVAVYGVDNANNWTETGITWNNQPGFSTGSLLVALDAGTITGSSSQWATWTDGGEGALSSWLETQRQTSAKSATLALAIENSNNPGLADVFFEDKEGSGAAHGCADSLGGPTLTVNDFVVTLIYLPLVLK